MVVRSSGYEGQVVGRRTLKEAESSREDETACESSRWTVDGEKPLDPVEMPRPWRERETRCPRNLSAYKTPRGTEPPREAALNGVTRAVQRQAVLDLRRGMRAGRAFGPPGTLIPRSPRPAPQAAGFAFFYGSDRAERKADACATTRASRRIRLCPAPGTSTRRARGQAWAMAAPSFHGTSRSAGSWKTRRGVRALRATRGTSSADIGTPRRDSTRWRIACATHGGMRNCHAKRTRTSARLAAGARNTARPFFTPRCMASAPAAAPAECPTNASMGPTRAATAWRASANAGIDD